MSSGSSAILREVIQKLVLSAIIVVSFSMLVGAQPPDNYSARWRAANTVVAMQGPYTWADTVFTKTTNYTVDTNYIVCEMRTTDSCVIKCKLRSRDSVPIRCTAGDIFRLDILKIYKVGTDSLAGINGKIQLFGIHK